MGTTLVSFCSVASLFLTRGTDQSTENSQCQAGPLPRARCQSRACWMADVSASGQQFPRYGFISATFVLFCSIAPILLKYTLLSFVFFVTYASWSSPFAKQGRTNMDSQPRSTLLRKRVRRQILANQGGLRPKRRDSKKRKGQARLLQDVAQLMLSESTARLCYFDARPNPDGKQTK